MKKVIDEVKQKIQHIQVSVKENEAFILEMKKALRHIPKEGRWTPFKIKKIRINDAVELVFGRYYIVKGKHGSYMHKWTEDGWQNLIGSGRYPLTHVWLPNVATKKKE